MGSHSSVVRAPAAQAEGYSELVGVNKIVMFSSSSISSRWHCAIPIRCSVYIICAISGRGVPVYIYKKKLKASSFACRVESIA